MGGTVTRAVTATATGGLSEFTHGADAFGVKTGLKALGMGGSSYTPTLLPKSDPMMELAQSGGAPLLTSIALGANVDDAVAGYFGRTKGQDYDAWYKGLSQDEKQAVDSVKTTLTQIQTNTDLRNQAVQKVVNDFPNIVQGTASAVTAAKQKAGEEFDAASKSYLDYANNAIAAKFGGSGTVSSGAAIAEANRLAAQLGIQKLQYQTEQGNTAYERGANDLLGAWQQQYTEANALRGFQQKMLGQGASQGFSAAQAALERSKQTNIANTGAINQAGAAKAAADNALTSQIFGLAGTAGLVGLTGGFGGGGRTSNPSPSPAPTPNSAIADYSSNGYRSA